MINFITSGSCGKVRIVGCERAREREREANITHASLTYGIHYTRY